MNIFFISFVKKCKIIRFNRTNLGIRIFYQSKRELKFSFMQYHK